MSLKERWSFQRSVQKKFGSGVNLLYCMNINPKFEFINQQANNNIVHFF